MPLTPQEALETYDEDLDNGPGAPTLLMRIAGNNPGKLEELTSRLSSIAREHDWIVIGETSRPGFNRRILHALGHDDDVPEHLMPLALRAAFHSTVHGLLITISRAENAERGEMVNLATAVQHAIGQGEAISLILAETPEGERRWLDDPTISFLRRAVPVRS